MSTLPKHFNYDPQTRALDVEFGDGSVIRYFEIDPRLAFLSDSNPRRNRDFINFLQNNPVKSEMIKEATRWNWSIETANCFFISVCRSARSKH